MKSITAIVLSVLTAQSALAADSQFINQGNCQLKRYDQNRWVTAEPWEVLYENISMKASNGRADLGSFKLNNKWYTAKKNCFTEASVAAPVAVAAAANPAPATEAAKPAEESVTLQKSSAEPVVAKESVAESKGLNESAESLTKSGRIFIQPESAYRIDTGSDTETDAATGIVSKIGTLNQMPVIGMQLGVNITDNANIFIRPQYSTPSQKVEMTSGGSTLSTLDLKATNLSLALGSEFYFSDQVVKPYLYGLLDMTLSKNTMTVTGVGNGVAKFNGTELEYDLGLGTLFQISKVIGINAKVGYRDSLISRALVTDSSTIIYNKGSTIKGENTAGSIMLGLGMRVVF